MRRTIFNLPWLCPLKEDLKPWVLFKWKFTFQLGGWVWGARAVVQAAGSMSVLEGTLPQGSSFDFINVNVLCFPEKRAS